MVEAERGVSKIMLEIRGRRRERRGQIQSDRGQKKTRLRTGEGVQETERGKRNEEKARRHRDATESARPTTNDTDTVHKTVGKRRGVTSVVVAQGGCVAVDLRDRGTCKVFFFFANAAWRVPVLRKGGPRRTPHKKRLMTETESTMQPCSVSSVSISRQRATGKYYRANRGKAKLRVPDIYEEGATEERTKKIKEKDKDKKTGQASTTRAR